MTTVCLVLMLGSVNIQVLKASLEDYADLIKNGIDGNPTIYKPTWKHEAIDYRDDTTFKPYVCYRPNYATKLNSLIKHYHLTDFDKKNARFRSLC